MKKNLIFILSKLSSNWHTTT